MLKGIVVAFTFTMVTFLTLVVTAPKETESISYRAEIKCAYAEENLQCLSACDREFGRCEKSQHECFEIHLACTRVCRNQ